MNTTPVILTDTIAFESKISSLFAQQKIALKDIETFSKTERRQLAQGATHILAELKDAERDDFIDKIESIIPPDTKYDLWEYNHAAIGLAISNFMSQESIMPNISTIAKQTGLSRQTVAKHFKEYRQQPEFTAAAERFKFMSHRVLAGVFKFATEGDMRAAKLYLETVGATNKQQGGTVVNAQNNYIQINNTILSQENLKQLTAEQLSQIESIITNKPPLNQFAASSVPLEPKHLLVSR